MHWLCFDDAHSDLMIIEMSGCLQLHRRLSGCSSVRSYPLDITQR